MDGGKLFPMEYRFMEIIWEMAPLSAGRLAALAAGRLKWQRTTSYTVLKRLIDRGYVVKNGKIVEPILLKEEADAAELSEVCDRCFGGRYEKMEAALKRLNLSVNFTDSLEADVKS